jgi:hypothetical protein
MPDNTRRGKKLIEHKCGRRALTIDLGLLRRVIVPAINIVCCCDSLSNRITGRLMYIKK